MVFFFFFFPSKDYAYSYKIFHFLRTEIYCTEYLQQSFWPAITKIIGNIIGMK